MALFNVLARLWFLSPLVTGVWLGRRLSAVMGRERGFRLALLGAVLLLALLIRIPYLGWLIALVSFVLALGGLLLARRTSAGHTTPAAVA